MWWTASYPALCLQGSQSYRAQEKGKAEADLTIDITEPVKANKYLESMKVFEDEAQPKPDLTTELESPETRDSITQT